MRTKRDILFIFNLELDFESQVLAVGHDWVEEFANVASQVYVFSTHIGSVRLPANVNFTEIGGGTFFKRIRGLIRLIKLVPLVLKLRKRMLVFHHMSTRTVLVLGPLFRFLGIPQGLWYSHSHKSFELVISSLIVDKLYSSTEQALPMKSKKSCFVGHGIPIKKFIGWRTNPQERNLQVISIGRLARIKNYESGISLVAKMFACERSFVIIGPGDKSSTYPNSLEKFSRQLNVDLKLYGPVPYEEVPSFLEQSKYFFSGTPKSVDKAAIEAALSGVFVLSENNNTMRLCGMHPLLISWGLRMDSSLEEIVSAIESLKSDEIIASRLQMSTEAELLNNLSNTCKRIFLNLQESQKS